MKISALVSLVAASRQARDAQSLFNKILGGHNNNVEQRKSVFSETASFYQMFQYYMERRVLHGNKGEFLKSLVETVHLTLIVNRLMILN